MTWEDKHKPTVQVARKDDGLFDLNSERTITLGQKLWCKVKVNHIVEDAMKHELEKVRDQLLSIAYEPDSDRYREELADALTYRVENLDPVELLNELDEDDS